MAAPHSKDVKNPYGCRGRRRRDPASEAGFHDGTALASMSGMRRTAMSLLLLASAALATGDARGSLERGDKVLAKARDAKGAKLLRVLEASKPHFKRARTIALREMEGAPGDKALARLRDEASQKLVGVLNVEAAIYLSRGARSLAAKRNKEALAILPSDARAKALKGAIESVEPYELEATMVTALLGGEGSQGGARATGVDERFLDRRAPFARP
jgi:hypothetical protein